MERQDGRSRAIVVFSENVDALMELLTAARELVALTPHRVIAAVVDPGTGDAAEQCAAHGADEVIVVRTGADRALGSEDLVSVLLEAVKDADPSVILIGATRTGTDIAASLAQTLEVPCASECVALAFDADDRLAVERRVYAGRFMTRQVFVGYPCVVTIAPKRFPRAEPLEARGAIRELTMTLPAPHIHVQATAQRSRSERDVTKADVIVTAGRGVRKMEDLELLDRLAEAFNGVLAGTRPLTGDLDWLPVDRRIGLSGQTVKPKLYIACGVSGQIEHIVGMKGARTVVAINNDPKAPIHAEADYSVVGDLYDIVPALLDACEKKTADSLP